MKKILLFLITMGLLLTTYSQEYIEISDTAFERFLVETEHDDIIDGYILKSTALSIDTLSIGLEYKITDKDFLTEFSNIETLYFLFDTLAELNLESNKNLKELMVRNYGETELNLYLDTLRDFNYIRGYNKIVNLYCNASKEISGEFRNVNFMNIDEIILNGNFNWYRKYHRIKQTNLKKITISNIDTEYQSFDITIENNPNLEQLNINNGSKNSVGELKINSNDRLQSITLDNIIDEIFWLKTITANTNLENIIIIDSVFGLTIQNNELDTLILQGPNTFGFNATVIESQLKAIYVDGFKDVNLDLSGNISLTNAVVSNAESITGLNLTGNEFLTCLNLEGCTNMSNINLDNCYSLSCVQVESNYIPIFPNKISSQESVGSYAVTDECSDCDFTITEYIEDIIDEDLTFINRTQHKKDLFIYPNPADDLIMLQMESNDYYSLVIRNITGQIVMQEQINNTQMQLDLSALECGLYLLELQGKDRSITEKIIIR